ncbi:MAG: hypothetical protein EBR82_75040 [Caulobacteraceae bacterium]|nr:hypothetical protein [Caulobacteraceae bacterium]
MDEYEDIITDYENIPACNPKNSCEVIQEFINKDSPGDEFYDIHNRIDSQIRNLKHLRLRMNALNGYMKEVEEDLITTMNDLDALTERHLNFTERHLELYTNKK